jgi:hypothetical protein
VSVDLEDRLVDHAVEYFWRSFPNPTREGCPRPDRLRELASSAEPVTGDVRIHLFQCSECFIEFRRERLAMTSARDTAARLAPPRVLRSRVRTIVAVAASMVLAAGLGLLLWAGFERAASQQKAASGGNAEPSPSRQSSGAASLTSNRPVPELPGVVAIQLDPSSVRRGSSSGLESSVPAATIRTGLIRFEIALPASYPDGVYLVAIVDPFDEALVEVSAPAVDRSLIALVDATGLGSGRRFLRIQRAGLPPDFVSIVLEQPFTR